MREGALNCLRCSPYRVAMSSTTRRRARVAVDGDPTADVCLIAQPLPFQGREPGRGRCPRRLPADTELGVAVRQVPFHGPHAQMHGGRN
jgi:hypothetical protein